jgi:hypothetical protein
MRGISRDLNCGIFSPEELACYEIATAAVASLPESSDTRCHEIARAVNQMLIDRGYFRWDVIDGYFGIAQHSWLVHKRTNCILDCYAVGSYPMVQLHNTVILAVRSTRKYKEDQRRDDIDEAAVRTLLSYMKEAP